MATDIATILSQLPKCAVKCLVEGASEHGCAPTDYVCQCSKTAEITRTVSPCMIRAGCDLEDLGGMDDFPQSNTCSILGGSMDVYLLT
jgi:hypothetical protein